MCPSSDENGGQPGCGCCSQYYNHSNLRICICLPYVDRYMITAQILSIVVFLISWFWSIPFIFYPLRPFSINWFLWVAYIVGVICFLSLQVMWCCRRSKVGMYISAVISAMAAVICSIAGIVLIVAGQADWEFGLVAFVTAILWFVTTVCILYFVKSGRHTRWEEKLHASVTTTTTTTTVATTLPTIAIEMRTLPHHQDDSHHHPQEQQSSIAVITASATAASSYVLPDILDKSDDV